MLPVIKFDQEFEIDSTDFEHVVCEDMDRIWPLGFSG